MHKQHKNSFDILFKQIYKNWATEQIGAYIWSNLATKYFDTQT